MARQVWATVQNNELIVRIPMNRPPFPGSSSGKTLIVASTGGNLRTGIQVPTGEGEARELIVGVNAYVYKEGQVARNADTRG